jgi:prolyl 4-hydroxylase
MIFLLLVAFYFLYLFYNDNNSSNTTKKIETILNPIDRCSQLYDRERVYEFDNLLTSQECNQIIEMAKPNISKSTVLSDEGTHSGRTSSHIFLKSTTELLQKIDTIVYNYLQIPIENYEDLQVVNYKSTQKYDAHYDACDPDEEICKNDIKTLGSLRYATFIFYLNDNFTGGETDFPHKNIKANPKVGKGVLFFNLNDDNTNRRHNSYHAGLPPTTGEKWMSNKWIRLKKIPWK